MSCTTLAHTLPQPCEADRGAQLQRLRMLTTRACKRAMKGCFHFRIERVVALAGAQQQQLAAHPMQLRLVPTLAVTLSILQRFSQHREARFASAGPSTRLGQQRQIVRLTKLCARLSDRG